MSISSRVKIAPLQYNLTPFLLNVAIKESYSASDILFIVSHISLILLGSNKVCFPINFLKGPILVKLPPEASTSSSLIYFG